MLLINCPVKALATLKPQAAAYVPPGGQPGEPVSLAFVI